MVIPKAEWETAEQPILQFLFLSIWQNRNWWYYLTVVMWWILILLVLCCGVRNAASIIFLLWTLFWIGVCVSCFCGDPDPSYGRIQTAIQCIILWGLGAFLYACILTVFRDWNRNMTTPYQCLGRLNRKGQQRLVIHASTVEEQIAKRIKEKIALLKGNHDDFNLLPCQKKNSYTDFGWFRFKYR